MVASMDRACRGRLPGRELLMTKRNFCPTSWVPLSLVAAFAVATLVLSPHARANVYKCKANDAGGVVYQEATCPIGKELRNFDTDPPDLSVIPGGPVPAQAAPSSSRTEKNPSNAGTARAAVPVPPERGVARG